MRIKLLFVALFLLMSLAAAIAAPIKEVNAAAGGPDYFGYTFKDNTEANGPTYGWVDITTTGTMILASSDDNYVDGIQVGFFFNFYGTDYSQVSITNNGIVLASGGTGQYINQPIGSSTPHNFILPFWDDIVTWGSAGAVYYQTIGDAPNRMFVVEWYDNQHYSSSTSGITFQVILYEGTNNIKFQYQDVDFGTVSGSTPSDLPPYNNGGSATVGIEGPTGQGLQYSYNQEVLTPGLAILFKFPQFAGTNLYLSKQAPAQKDHGSSMTYSIYYHNFGDGSAQNVVLVDSLPAGVDFVSASDGGIYDSNTRHVTWAIGSLAPLGHGTATVTVMIGAAVPIGTVIENHARISTSTLEVRYDDNEATAQTSVTGSSLPANVGVEPNNGGGGTPSVYWGTPTTFSYHSSATATAVDITIHIDDGGSDITGSMVGGPPDWTYTTTFYPRHGQASVTYVVHGASCQPSPTLPDGLHIPASQGLIGLEQHLYNDQPGDGYVPPGGDFSAAGLAGTPAGYSTYSLDNGYAGTGAFAPHPSNLSEEYYVTMRWPDGVTWHNDGSRDVYDSVTYGKYAHKKVLIVAPATGKCVIASIEEAGPAPWTGKDAGAPPEVFVALGLYPRGDGQNEPSIYTLQFYWADQSAPLGPCAAQHVTFNIYIDPAGYIYDINTSQRIAAATVWLQRPDGVGGWENVPTGEAVPVAQPDVNPQITGDDGQYQWDVLPGSYRIHVEATGYYPADSIVVSIPPAVTDLHVGLTHLPRVISCDSAGNAMEQFAPGQSVYVKGSGFEPNTNYAIWIQDDPVAEGEELVTSEDPSLQQESVTTDGSGAFGPLEIWAIPSDAVVTYHQWDIVIDRQNDGGNTGIFNSVSDGIDSMAAVGFIAPVPEVTPLILFGSGLLLLGSWVVWTRRRRAIA